MGSLLNVFFDLDGTLIDPREGITRCLRYTLRCLNRPVPQEGDLLVTIGPPLRSVFRSLLDTQDSDLVEQAVTLYRKRYSNRGLLENKVYTGVPDMLADLKASGYRLYVATSKPRVFAERIIQYLEFGPFFEHVFGPNLNGHLDDKTELVKDIITRCGLAPERTLMVGDRRHDVLAGKANQIATIGITYGYGSFQEISEAAPDLMCDSPKDLALTVKRLQK